MPEVITDAGGLVKAIHKTYRAIVTATEAKTVKSHGIAELPRILVDMVAMSVRPVTSFAPDRFSSAAAKAISKQLKKQIITVADHDAGKLPKICLEWLRLETWARLCALDATVPAPPEVGDIPYREYVQVLGDWSAAVLSGESSAKKSKKRKDKK